MRFYFNGQERLCLCFFSPNHCAVVLVAFIFVLLALFFWLRRQNRSYFVWLSSLVMAMCLCLLLGLALTYCRGGYVAFLTVSIVMAFLSGKGIPAGKKESESSKHQKLVRYLAEFKHRFLSFPAFLVISFIVMVFLVPSGGKRLQTISDETDKSIIHRLYLWRGGTVLFSQNVLHGVGAGPGELYSLWLQPSSVDEHYYGLISDALTLGASYGVGAAWLYLFALAFFCLLGWSEWKVKHKKEFLSLIGVFASVFICGLFNCGYMLRSLQCIVGLCALYLVFEVFRCKHCIWKKLLFSCFFACMFATASCLFMYLCGLYFQDKVPWLINGSTKIPLTKSRIEKIRLSPSHFQTTCRLLYITDEVCGKVRPIAIPLSESGVDMTIISVEGKIGEKEKISSIIKDWVEDDKSGKTLFLMSDSMNVSNAVYVALSVLSIEFQPKYSVFYDIIRGHPFKEMAVESITPKTEYLICEESFSDIHEEASFLKIWLESKGVLMRRESVSGRW